MSDSQHPGAEAAVPTAASAGVASSVVPALDVVGLSKTFDGTQVLTDIRFDVLPGEVHALVGENGSGKSTTVKILAGVYDPDDGGAVTVAGTALDLSDPSASDAAGLRFVHQDLGLVAALDARDNLALGQGYDTGWPWRIRWRSEGAAAREALDRLGYDIDVTQPVSTLSISERTAIAIARALSPRRETPAVVVLDEPTANLPESEVRRLAASIRRLSAAGIGVLFISHHFEEVFDLADRVTVLRDGKVVTTRPVAELDHGSLVELMTGRTLDVDHVAQPQSELRDVVLATSGLNGAVVRDLDLTVAGGEVVGVAGITGSGREEVARLVAGDLSPESGEVVVAGRRIAAGRPDLCKAAGMSYVPAERKTNGIVTGHSVAENVVIADLRPLRRRGALRARLQRRDADAWIERLDVRPRDGGLPIESLSGGNQQKVVLARALRLSPTVLVLDEPTQGVDVGAQAQIRSHIRAAVAEGLGVLVCSSSSEELAEMCDRVVVMVGGRRVRDMVAPMEVDEITAATLQSVAEGTA
ncbi:sugar ABC transporter ATP-binding protein [Aeromicrobium sp.]|uniref:sugar ABC transporter ATP-binding protein n=1 Tax=Aeromicrobium sp. TaxID=1871063 RepID=UPI0025C555AF|nr:sugar ABC transporter ATP-binding protein [Aeromicrobium sp.]MCK5892626.1 sugar ABC transporter ATP-binding protein [Aeromicrobium sp.]